MKRICNVVTLGLVLLAGPALAQQNPPSEVIADLTIHPERISLDNGDNWPITCSDDGSQYTVYCDGEGFGGGSGEGSMSLARIVCDPPNVNGENLASPTGHKTGGGPEGRKASGLLMVDGVLDMWVRNLNEDGTGWLLYSCFPEGPYQFNVQKCALDLRDE